MMPDVVIVNEGTEDTIGCAEDLQCAIRLAREAARQAEPGDMITILERGGTAVKQFILQPGGTVAEQAIARPVNLSRGEPALNGAAKVTTADQPGDTKCG